MACSLRLTVAQQAVAATRPQTKAEVLQKALQEVGAGIFGLVDVETISRSGDKMAIPALEKQFQSRKDPITKN